MTHYFMHWPRQSKGALPNNSRANCLRKLSVCPSSAGRASGMHCWPRSLRISTRPQLSVSSAERLSVQVDTRRFTTFIDAVYKLEQTVQEDSEAVQVAIADNLAHRLPQVYGQDSMLLSDRDDLLLLAQETLTV